MVNGSELDSRRRYARASREGGPMYEHGRTVSPRIQEGANVYTGPAIPSEAGGGRGVDAGEHGKTWEEHFGKAKR